MRNAPVQKLGPAPSEKPRTKLRSAAPLSEGLMPLSEREILNVMRLFGSQSAGRRHEAFLEARDKVRKTYGAVLEVVGGRREQTRVVARHEFRTTDRALDTELENLVTGMGFSLSMKSAPRTDLPLNERYERRVRLENVLSTDPKTYVWYEQKCERTYVIKERKYGTSDVQHAERTARNFLRLLEMLRPPMKEDMPKLPGEVVDINSARAASAEPVSGQVLADQALTALRSC